jgi:uncharacterized membrane protein YccC
MASTYLNTFAKTATLGLGFGVFFCYTVNITNPIAFHPAQFLDTAFGLSLGIAAAAVAFSTIVPLADDWISTQYLKQIRSLVTRSARDDDLDALPHRFESGMRGFIMRIASAPAGERVDQTRLVAAAFAALEVGRAMIAVREDSVRIAGSLPERWDADQRAWLAAMSDVIGKATPDARAHALRATESAQRTLLVKRAEDAGDAFVARRMQRLMHFSERMLKDDTLPLWRTFTARRPGVVSGATT